MHARPSETPARKPAWTRGWEAIVDARSYPVLAELLRSEQGAEARAELERLIGHFWQARAERHTCRVQAKLLLPSTPDAPVDVTTRDVSTTGILVTVPFGAEIDVMMATHLSVMLRAHSEVGARMLRMPASLVRVAGTDDEGARLAFRFVDPSPSDVSLLGRLTDVA